MIDLLPAHVPALHVLTASIGAPHPDRIARALGVSRRTVYRWIETGDAPRVALLALWPLTCWGRSHFETEAHNRAALADQHARSLEQELRKLQRRIQYLQGLNDQGAANGPLWMDAPGLPAVGRPVVAATAATLSARHQRPQLG